MTKEQESKLKQQFLKLYREDESIINFLPDSAFRKAICCFYKKKKSLEQIAKKTGITRQGVHSHCKNC